MIDRRVFLKFAGLVPLIGAAPRLAFAADEITTDKDYTLRIGTGLVELAPDHIVSTTLYGSLTTPAKPAGERESDAAPTHALGHDRLHRGGRAARMKWRTTAPCSKAASN
jgi:hypothetical protein